MGLSEQQKMTRQILLTSAILACVVLLFDFSSVDIWVQDFFYNFELKRWVLDRNDKLLRIIFYDGIKAILVIIVLLLIGALVFLRKTNWVQTYRQGLMIVCIAGCLVPLVVGALKSTTNVPCPKYITHYDGDYPHVTILSSFPENFQQAEPMECYPAGHASGGFAFMSLFFLFKRRRNRIIGLSSAIILGWTIGLYKMAIGDHFLSHTVVTMVLAWLIILIVARQVLMKSVKMSAGTG